MSMLAEPRRKANWVLNPKNTHWTADTSKFGLRIMEKMGWTEGNGLGANEQGSTEHIKVKVRSDNRGVGFQDRPEDELVHQSEFSHLLEQLASETPPLKESRDETKSAGIASLEEKSQMSRSRVHYRKFTRGKDLSRYSEKDLASILGKPANHATNSAFESDIAINGKGNLLFQSDVATIERGNMFEYFRKKMTSIGLVEERAMDASTSEEICAGNGLCEVNGTEYDIAKTSVTKKKKKSKKAAKDFEQSTLGADLNALENNEIVAETRKERKRKGHEVLKISGPEIELEKINFGIENGLYRKQCASGSEDCINNVFGGADGAGTKKERKKRRKAEKALKYAEKQTKMEDAKSEIVEKRHDGKSEQTLESAIDDNVEHEKKDENVLLAEFHAVKKKKQRRKFERELESCQHGTGLENMTNLVENPKDEKSRKISNSTLEDGEQTENTYKHVERKEKHKKIKKTSGDKDIGAKNEMEVHVGCDSAYLRSEGRKKKKSKKSKIVSDQSTYELGIQDNAVHFAGIEKKKKRKSDNDVDVDVMPDDGASKKKKMKRTGELCKNSFPEANAANGINDVEEVIKDNGLNTKKSNYDEEIVGQTPITGVKEPEFFCDARSKKAKKKAKLTKKTEELNDRLAADSETPKDTANVLKTDIEFTVEEDNGFSVVKERKMKCTAKGRGESQLSERLEETNRSASGEVECNIDTKKDRQHKRRSRDPPSLEAHKDVADAFKEEEDCITETKKDKKKKNKSKDRDAAISPEKMEHDILNKNNALPEEIFSREQIQSEKNAVSLLDSANLRPQEDVENVLGRLKNVIVGDTFCAELTTQEDGKEIDTNAMGEIETKVDKNAKIKTSNEVGKISSNKNIIPVIDSLENKAPGLPENTVAFRKPVSIVELDGKVYINGICNFELSHPIINNVELRKIPAHLRNDVKFLPIPGANVDEFGYVGLPCPKGKSEIA